MSFIPFVVQCQTCGSRLKVSDPGLIGTIASCPKCNSMVQVAPESVPSTPQVAVGSASVDTGAITEDAIDAGHQTGNDPESVSGGFAAGGESVPSDGQTVPSAIPPDWQSERTQRSRQIGLIVALSLSSLVAAVMLFGWFVRSMRDDATVAVATDAGTEVDTAESQATGGEDAVVASDVTDPSETNTPVSPDTEPNQSAAANTGDPSVEQADTPDDASPASEGPLPPSDPPGNSTDDVTTPDTAQPGAIPTDLLPQSPLGPLDMAAEPAESDPDASSLEELPEGLQKFVPVLNLGPQAPVDDEQEAGPTVDVNVDEAADLNIDPMLVANPPEAINLRRALAIEFALSPSNGKYPMSDLILVISQISGVPIQIDWVTFDLIGVDIADEIPVKQGWNSAEVFLESIAAAVGGEIKKTEQMLKLAPSEATKRERLGAILDLADFGAGRQSAVAVMNEFLPWGDVKASLDQDADQQKLAALAAEALRRVRGVAPKVGDASFQRWAQSADGDSLDWPVLVEGDSGPQFDAPLTMAGFLRRTARRNQATCFVNWFDANLRRMSPAQLIMPFTNDKAGVVVGNELKPFGLQLRVVDQRHWWVGTAGSYDRFPVIVYTAPLGADRGVFSQRLQNAISSTDGEVFRLAVDPDTGCAVILLPRYLVRQLPKIQNGLNLTRAH